MEEILRKIETFNNSSLMRLLYGFLAVFTGQQPLLRNYRPDPQLDAVLIKLITKENDLLIKTGEYYSELENDNCKIVYWCENKYYAWMNSGVYTNKKNGYVHKWNGAMPSRFITEMWLKFTTQVAKNSI